MALHLLIPPAFTLAELRTITAVTGIPPNKPETVFPTPWASNSLFGGVMRLCGSILSEASMLSRDSMDAINMILMAMTHTTKFPNAPKFGK